MNSMRSGPHHEYHNIGGPRLEMAVVRNAWWTPRPRLSQRLSLACPADMQVSVVIEGINSNKQSSNTGAECGDLEQNVSSNVVLHSRQPFCSESKHRPFVSLRFPAVSSSPQSFDPDLPSFLPSLQPASPNTTHRQPHGPNFFSKSIANITLVLLLLQFPKPTLFLVAKPLLRRS